MAVDNRSDGVDDQSGDVLRHPLRIRIRAACEEEPTTPRKFAEREGLPVPNVNYHFSALEKAGYLEVVRKEQARGGLRHYYVATRLGMISDEEFALLSRDEQAGVSEATLRDLLVRGLKALKAGTLDAREDSIVLWLALWLDEQGWQDLVNLLKRTLEGSLEIQAESLTRLKKNGQTPIHTTLALADFESPSVDFGASGPLPPDLAPRPDARSR